MSELWNLKGKTVFITGGNAGIGRETALRLADQGARVWLACRNGQKAQPVVDEIRQKHGERAAEFVPLDLGSLQSVRQCGQSFLATGEPLHVLVNNAGLAGARGLTREGFEEHFGVNHLGHFLLTELLRPALVRSAPARVVIVASRAHQRVSGVDWDALRRPAGSGFGFSEYSQSKLCNVLHARVLAQQLASSGVDVHALHPGVIASEIWRHVPQPFRALMHLFMEDSVTGARTTLHCASSPELAGVTGTYFDRLKRSEPAAVGRDDAAAAELWRRSVEWTR